MEHKNFTPSNRVVPRLSEEGRRPFETRQQYRARMRALVKQAKKGLKA